MAAVSSGWRRELDLTANAEPAHEALDCVGAITTKEVIGGEVPVFDASFEHVVGRWAWRRRRHRKRKGPRTVAQTGKVLDVLHRPGKVHDSNGASAFIFACLSEIRQLLPRVILKVRMDCALFSDEIVSTLETPPDRHRILRRAYDALDVLSGNGDIPSRGTSPLWQQRRC